MSNKTTLTMKDLPEQERPYELLETQGAAKLTDAQLLAIFLRSGRKGEKSLDMAYRLLTEQQVLPEEALCHLFQLSLKELKQYPGIGRVKAIQIAAVSELAKRFAYQKASAKFSFDSPRSIAMMYMERMRHLKAETPHVVYVTTKMDFLGEEVHAPGTVSASFIDIRRIFLTGASRGAFGFFLLHNHPSGNPEPSHQDFEITEHLLSVSKLLEMPMLDHIIIGDQSYFSFREQGHIYTEGDS